MATAAVDEEKDVLTCSVCLDSYTDPYTLQCKQSFCRRCITDYVKTQADAVHIKTTPCRQVTLVPDPSRPVDEWAWQLQPGHVVQKLMAGGNNNMEDTPCFPCQQQLEETAPGKFWRSECETDLCQKCGRNHSVMPNNRDHDLCDLKDKGRISRCKVRCRKHREELIELYCNNCNVSHCYLCSVDHHRKCDDVVTVKSFWSDMKTELSELNHQLEQQEYKPNNLQKTMISQMKTDKISVIDEIRSTTQKDVDMIKDKEKEMIDQEKQITNKNTDKRKSKVKQGNIQMQTYRQYSENITQTVSSDSELEICDVYQVWKSGQLDASQEGDGVIGGGNISSVRLSRQKQNITEVLDSLHLGEIVTTNLPTDVLSSPVLSEVDTRLEQDEGDPGIHDITVLEVKGVKTTVVTDWNNKCLKSFYTMDSGPWGITQLGDNRVMVAVPYSNQILTVAVTSDLVCMSRINTSKGYDNLTVMSPSRFAAGGGDCVDILNMQGEMLKSVTTHNNMKLFESPRYMCISNTGHLLVSDWGKKTVTSEGHTVWIYSGTGEGKLRWPRGITTTGGGDILFVDSDLKKVIQLSESGEYVRDVLTQQDGLRYPDGICVDKHGSLYICNIYSSVLKFAFIRK